MNYFVIGKEIIKTTKSGGNTLSCLVPYFKSVFDFKSLLFLVFIALNVFLFYLVIFKKPINYFKNINFEKKDVIIQFKMIWFLTITFLLIGSYLGLYFRDCNDFTTNYGNFKIIFYFAGILTPISLLLMIIILNKKLQLKMKIISSVITILIGVLFLNLFIELSTQSGNSFLVRNFPYIISLIFIFALNFFVLKALVKEQMWKLKNALIFASINWILLFYFIILNLFKSL